MGTIKMENFFLFVIMSILLIILPGPDTAIATKNTLSAGRTGGFKTLAGTFCALLIHTIAAVIGLSAIIVKSALLFSIFKYVGAVYLVYLGIKTLLVIRSKHATTPNDMASESKYNSQSHFKQGFLTNMLNPKVAIFFLTFLPQFVDPGSNTLIPFLLMGLTYAILTAVWFFMYIFLVDQISAFMKKPKTTTVIESLTGAVLIGFGIKLALEKSHH
jgi:RhtB (resistance to homoserine/threonine) family protein